MSEDIKPEEQKEELPNGGRPFLQISVMENGGLNVVGVIKNKGLSYQLLEMAKDEIRNYHEKQQKIMNVNHSGGLLNMIRGRR